MTFTVVVPTYNRPDAIQACLDSILKQTLLPKEILVIDDGDLLGEFQESWGKIFSEKKVEFVYRKKRAHSERRGLSESKNLALHMAKNDIIFYLDDDVVLEENFFQDIMLAWEEDAEHGLAGVGGVIRNNREKSFFERMFNVIFGLSSRMAWDVNGAGFQVWDDHINSREESYYMHGGVASYKKAVLLQLAGFKVFEGGRTGLEDVELSFRAKNANLHFIIEPKAGVIHNTVGVIRENLFQTGYKESQNRKRIFRLNPSPNVLLAAWFVWANIGWILRQYLAGHIRKATGMLQGFLFNRPV